MADALLVAPTVRALGDGRFAVPDADGSRHVVTIASPRTILRDATCDCATGRACQHALAAMAFVAMAAHVARRDARRAATCRVCGDAVPPTDDDLCCPCGLLERMGLAGALRARRDRNAEARAEAAMLGVGA